MSTHENHDEFTNEADCEAAGHSWMEDAHGDEEGPVCHDEVTHENHDEYTNEADCEAAGYHWMEDDHDDEPETPAEALEMFDTNNDSFISLEEFLAAMEAGDHADDHGDHTDDHLDERNHYTMTVVMDDETHMIELEVEDLVPNATATNMTTNGLAMDNMTWNISGGMLYAIDDVASPSDWSWYWELHLWNETSGWYPSNFGMDSIMMEDAVHIAWAKNTTDDSTILPPPHHMDHDDHDELEHELEMAMNTYLFGAADANSDGLLNMSDLETLFDMIANTMDYIDTDAMVSIYLDVFDEDENDLISLGEFTEMMESMSDDVGHEDTDGTDDDHDDHGDHGDHGDDHGGDDHDEMTEMIFTMLDTNEDGSLDASELHAFMEMSEDEHEEGVAFIGFHVEEEGDYAIAVPAGVTMHVLTGGGHDDHAGHGGHDDHSEHGDEFEWAGIFEMNDDSHTWSMQKVDGDYADPTMWLVLIPTDTVSEDTMHDLESGVDALVDAGCTVVEDGETMSSIADDGTCFELHVGTGDDSTFTIDTAGITGMAMYAQHVPTEFERDQHYLKDSTGLDIEPTAQEGAGAHDHGHGNEEIAFDPHSWLDPVAFAAQVEVVYTTLSEAFPDHAETFRENADAYKAELLALDQGFSAALSETGTCSTTTVAANHNAYAYISQRYGVEFVTLHGLDPEGEPSPENVADVLESVEVDGIKAIFVEEYTENSALDSLIAQTVSEDLPDGLAILTLYTMEIAPSDSDENYMTMMTKNLDHLMIGMGC